MAYENLFEKLLRAETEDTVTAALAEHGFDRSSDEHWVPYGNMDNNFGIVGAQQADPLAALVEKLVNSVDAVLLRECYSKGIDPTGPDAPRTMSEAARQFLGIPEGNLARLPSTQRTALAEKNISVVFTGSRPKKGFEGGNPCILIVDSGEGQFPKDFGRTLVSLLKSNKLKIPFVQGKYNMGGSGCLSYCSPRHRYQLVASRRNHVLTNGHPSKWGFTLVRCRPAREGERTRCFEYLAPNGSIPELDIDEVMVLPEKATPYAKSHQSGTVLKLYEYQIKDRTNATLDFFRSLSLKLWDVAVPFRVTETRGYDAHTPSATFSGMNIRLDEDRAEVLEDGFPCSFALNIPGVGEMEGRICLFKPDAEVSRWVTAREAVVYTLNGQSHGSITRDFFTRKAVELPWISRQLLVSLDCSKIDSDVRDNLFMTSRDRTREIAEKKLIEEALAAFLKKHQGLRNANERRRLQIVSEKMADDKQTGELFQDLVRHNPSLAEILGLGLTVKIPKRGEVETDKFEGKRFPTFLKIHNVSNPAAYSKACPVNSYCRVVLETDVENEYFSRAVDPGSISVEPHDLLKTRHLYNGLLEIQLQPRAAMAAGDEAPIKVNLTSPDAPDGSFEVSFGLRIAPAEKKEKRVSPPNPPPKTSAAALPQIVDVFKAQWSEDIEINSEADVVKINKDANGAVSLVNMDNIHLHNYLRANTKKVEEIRHLYKLSVTMMGLWLEDQVKKGEIEDDKRRPIANSLGRLLLPMIHSLGSKLVEIEQS